MGGHRDDLDGSWDWYNGQTVVIHRDHNCEVFLRDRRVNDGHWEWIGESRIRINWNYHGYVNVATVSDDGRFLYAESDQLGRARFARR